MPINKSKTYQYTPPDPNGAPERMGSSESFRARTDAAGTFFRAKEAGFHGNSISVEITSELNVPANIIDLDIHDEVTLTIRAPIKNSKPVFNGIGTGKIINIILSPSTSLETITLIAISQHQFSVTGSSSGSMGTLTIGKVFTYNELKLSVIEGSRPFEPLDSFVFSIEDSTEVYGPYLNVDLNDPDNPPLTPVSSPAYTNMRNDVNTNSLLIEMTNRGYDYVDLLGTDDESPRSVRPYSPTPPTDPVYMPDQLEINLKQGQGFPETPLGIKTGTGRSLVHINRGENDDGTINEINKVFEWTGSSAYDGGFTQYSN